MAVTIDEAEFDDIWERWLAVRNVRGLKTHGVLAIFLYPAFLALDWVLYREFIEPLLYLRMIVVLSALAVLAVTRTRWADRFHNLLAGGFTVVCAFDILAMLPVIGGAHVPYYAGISLVLLGTGLLYQFTLSGAIRVYGGIVAIWLAMCVRDTSTENLSVIVNNSFFLMSTAVLVVVGQYFSFRTQKEMVRSNRILEKTKLSLESAHENLKKLDRFKSQFFANITHELKTPLAMILSPLELLLNGDMGRVGDEQKATLQSMFRNGLKLLKMIQDLLDLSKLEESRIRLKVSDLDLVDHVRQIVTQALPLTQRKRIEMTFVPDVAAAVVTFDPERMERVFVNLLSNAAKFTPDGGHVRVELHDLGPSVRVDVIDDGPGFPSDKADQVFERFFQVDMEGTRSYGGTGIGLALARNLVDLHGGRIWAESEEGRGATFHVELLKGRDHFRPDALERRAERRDVPGGKRESDRTIMDWTLELAGRGDYRLLDIAEVTERRIVERDPDEHARACTVLVVEDTPDVTRLVHLSLRHHFRVFTAPNGRAGLEMALKEQPNLIVTDLMMPEMDGLEMTGRLRADPRTKFTPIVMLTARGDLEDRVEGIDRGVNVYLTKPFSPRELLATVRNLLNIEESAADRLLTNRMDSLEQVASGLAHEINNPLNYVKNAVEIIRGDSAKVRDLIAATEGRLLVPAEREQLARIETRVTRMFDAAEAGVKRISATVGLMRKYSREGYARVLGPHDVFAAVRDVVALVLPATGRDVRVEIDCEGVACVDCVPEEIHQVVTNLVQNAIEAAPEGTGRVRIHGRVADGHVLLSVRDNGPGIPVEIRERIFTPFFTTKGPGRGMGLGLTISWRVVDSLGGEISVDSPPGSGAEFRIRLPESPGGSSICTNGQF